MPESVNLEARMRSSLPGALVDLVRALGAAAAHQGHRLYLVGGVVRDLLLGRSTFDLDLVVEGDALGLARLAANVTGGRLLTHARFRTANLTWNGWSLDLTTARSETYERPGALPTVWPGVLADDLFRRDFTINAMAVHLNPGRYGDLVDLYGGQQDLAARLIRVLHEGSFIDDATRIWRALRYEQRLGFRLERRTGELLARDVAMLDTISGDRLRHELELVLREDRPERALLRADELGVLRRLHPDLRADGWLAARFLRARRHRGLAAPSMAIYMALLTYRLGGEAVEQVISRLKLPGRLARVLRDTQRLRGQLADLEQALPPSGIYRALDGFSLPAITACLLATDSPQVRWNLVQFLDRLRRVRPALTGDDLLAMGVPPGPRLANLLQRLRDARLDGEVGSRQGEKRLVEGWLREEAGEWHS